jgi:cytochrome oxidase Cu insertion factor (SCO1/SenC/PrrC family)
MTDSTRDPQSSKNPWTVLFPILIIGLGLVVFYNYYLYTTGQSQGEKKDRPPYLNKAEDDIILTERDGREVRMSELRGKTLLIAWCEPEDPAIMPPLKELLQEAGRGMDLHVVVFAADADASPESLRAMTIDSGFSESDPIWVVRGDPGRVGDFMTRELGLRPTVTDGKGRTIFDTRVCLLDSKGNVRRLADLLNPDPEFVAYWEEQLTKDLDYLLESESEDTP